MRLDLDPCYLRSQVTMISREFCKDSKYWAIGNGTMLLIGLVACFFDEEYTLLILFAFLVLLGQWHQFSKTKDYGNQLEALVSKAIEAENQKNSNDEAKKQ
jgi:hypothetical protein